MSFEARRRAKLGNLVEHRTRLRELDIVLSLQRFTAELATRCVVGDGAADLSVLREMLARDHREDEAADRLDGHVTSMPVARLLKYVWT
jgi:hypothetical protein